jgi:hypothetical protein
VSDASHVRRIGDVNHSAQCMAEARRFEERAAMSRRMAALCEAAARSTEHDDDAERLERMAKWSWMRPPFWRER